MARSRRKTAELTGAVRPTDATDEELLAALARGDRELGAELCRRLSRVVDATLYRVLGRRDADYDDLAQAAFEQIVGSLCHGKFSGECALSTWASAITCNVALQAIRRRKVERRLFDRSHTVASAVSRKSSSTNPEAQISARRDLERLQSHLSRLSKKHSQTLLLHDMLGFGIKETAVLIGISHAAARSRLVRGRKELSLRLRHDQDLLSDWVVR